MAQLKEIGEYLIDIHGQHDNQSLLRNKAQIDYLTRFGKRSIIGKRATDPVTVSDINQKITGLGHGKERARLEDLYRYQTQEISAAALKEEDLELSRQISSSPRRNIVEVLPHIRRYPVMKNSVPVLWSDSARAIGHWRIARLDQNFLWFGIALLK